jgi:hypothetical protein
MGRYMSETDDELEARVREMIDRGCEYHCTSTTSAAGHLATEHVRACLRVIDRERARADRHIQLHTIEESRVWSLTTRLDTAERLVRESHDHCDGHSLRAVADAALAERDALRARLEVAERVVEAARAFVQPRECLAALHDALAAAIDALPATAESAAPDATEEP